MYCWQNILIFFSSCTDGAILPWCWLRSFRALLRAFRSFLCQEGELVRAAAVVAASRAYKALGFDRLLRPFQRLLRVLADSIGGQASASWVLARS